MSTLNEIGATLPGISPQSERSEATTNCRSNFLYFPIVLFKQFTMRILP